MSTRLPRARLVKAPGDGKRSLPGTSRKGRRPAGSRARAAAHVEPRRRPRQERARATVAAILEAAADQIAHEGFAAMTTNRVAARAGVSIGSLYQYFPNKQALLVALLEEHLGALGPVVERSLEEMADPAIPFGEALRRMFVALVGLHDDADPRLQRALGEEVPHPPHIRERRRRKEREYVERLATILRERSDVHSGSPEMTARVLVQATSALTRWLAHDAPRTLDRGAYIREAVGLLTAHVQQPPAARRSGSPR